jgi:hypothetical protein
VGTAPFPNKIPNNFAGERCQFGASVEEVNMQLGQDRFCLFARLDRDSQPVEVEQSATAGRRHRRCSAAHVADPRPCEGAIDVVQIVDQTGASGPAWNYGGVSWLGLGVGSAEAACS